MAATLIKHPDHKGIVTWRTVPGPPQISQIIMDAARKVTYPVVKLPRIGGKAPGSIRIRQEIEQKNRVPTPTPQPRTWQRVKSAAPAKPRPSFARPTQSKRVLSAPPATDGYTFYKQATMNGTNAADTFRPMQERLKAWADTANDYEKQVVYGLLNRAAQPRDGPPSTPPSPQEAYHLLLRAKSVPAERITSIDRSSDKRSTWSPYFNDLRRKQTKQRNLNSAPIKPMLGLVPSATQYPQRDQRSFRLRGQDHRVPGNPADERELKEYLSNVAKVTQKQWRQPDKKSVYAPMHSYPSDQRKADPDDYKCDVSFFQSVRAPFKSHFVIHPDFTSENFIQKKHANQMVSHIRY